MGRGDKKSKKGKRFKGSYGVVRPKKTNTSKNKEETIAKKEKSKKSTKK